MSFIYFYIFILVHPYLAMWWKTFSLMGRKPWEAWIPIYNYFVAYKVLLHKGWWCSLFIVPGVHLVMWSIINLCHVRRFGYYSLLDTIQGIFFPYFLFWKISRKQVSMQAETNWANSKEVEIRKWGDHLVLFLVLPVIGHAIALGIGMFSRPHPGARSKVKEWGDSILWALIPALILRTYVFEPFRIPTGSMERTLLVGDFLFVNKLSYGPKVPVTPLSYPLVHNTTPVITMKSYSTLEKGTYTRLPGFGKIQRYDVVVFNYPAGDTAVYDPRMPYGLMGHEYEGIVNDEAHRLFVEWGQRTGRFLTIRDSIAKLDYNSDLLNKMINEQASTEFIQQLSYWKNRARKVIAEDKISQDKQTGQLIKHHGIIYRPVDKRENYIKRCVGMPGDFIEIKNSILYVNDKQAQVATHQNILYIASEPGFETAERLYELFGIETSDIARDYGGSGTIYGIHCNLTTIEKVRKKYPHINFDVSVRQQFTPDSTGKFRASEQIENLMYFPKDINVSNNVSNFERIQIPYKGKIVDFTKENIAYYRRIITAYEHHSLEEKADGIYIDGKKTNSYTVEMNYYWMMGDNRYQSADSRTWGFVPEDHIVGRASMTWYSSNPEYGVRWDRVFKKIK